MNSLHPLTVFLYYLIMIVFVAVANNPIIYLVSFVAAVLYYLVKNGKGSIRFHVYSFIFFVVLALVNPIISHNGSTVLFVINNMRITAEAFYYGIFSSLMIIGILYWCSTFSEIMTEDKLMLLFGKISTKLALILTMTLRFVPNFLDKMKRIDAVQKANGLYKDDNIISLIKGKLRVFNILVTWSLENSVVTADSMTARGYGIGKRSQYSRFGYHLRDVVFLLITLLLAVVLFYIKITAGVSFEYYPELVASKITGQVALYYILFGVLAILPSIIEVEEKCRWKFFKSTI